MPPLNLLHTTPTRVCCLPASPQYDTPTRDATSSMAPGRSLGASEDVIEAFQHVTESCALGPQVLEVLGIRVDRQGHALDDVEAEAF